MVEMRKTVLPSFKILCLLSTAFLMGFTLDIQTVKANGTIYIRADGSVDGTDKIQRDGDNYTFTDNIYKEIVVQRSNIIIDGNGCTQQGARAYESKGISLSDINNVTIKNTNIMEFHDGLYLYSSSNNTIFGNNITKNRYGIALRGLSLLNIISGNNVTDNKYVGIDLCETSYNTISGNNVTDTEWYSIVLDDASNNTLSGNNIKNGYSGIDFYMGASNNIIVENNITNNQYGIRLAGSSNNSIYHNNFVTHYKLQAWASLMNAWDNGVEGNYWNDYTGDDLDGDGIGDTPYIIDENNQDNYPLINLWSPPQVREGIPFWMQWWFYATLVTAIGVLALVVYLMKRKPVTLLPSESLKQSE